MKRLIAPVALFTCFAAAVLVAQAPQGWKLRVDRSTMASDPDPAGTIKFTATPTGFHAVTPQAAVFWHPNNVATGPFKLKGTFTLVKPSSHTNYYGLVFGGSGLDGPMQNYLYFVVGQDGTWLIKRRNGDAATENIVTKTPNPAVAKPDAAGQSVNVLEVNVAADKVDYLVNGTVVHSMPKSALPAGTDGLYGIRSNHALEVKVDGLAVSK
jgi:hypothetical protein